MTDCEREISHTPGLFNYDLQSVVLAGGGQPAELCGLRFCQHLPLLESVLAKLNHRRNYYQRPPSRIFCWEKKKWQKLSYEKCVH